MLWVNLIFALLPLLTENVQAADSYFGNNRYLNLRRPLPLGSKPNAVVDPTHTIPKPLPQPIEVQRERVPEITTLEYNDQSAVRPNYRLLPPRDPLPVKVEAPVTTIATEPTTIIEEVTTALYTNPPDVPSSDDIQVFRQPLTNPPGRTLLPRPLPLPHRVELNRPDPTIEREIRTTSSPLPTIPIEENRPKETPKEPLIVVLPDSSSTSLPPTTELVLIPIDSPKETETIRPEAISEIIPEKVEDPPQPEAIIVEEKEESVTPARELTRVKSPRPLVPNRRPELSGKSYIVPKPVVTSSRPIVTSRPIIATTPRPIAPKTFVTQTPVIKVTPPVVIKPRPSAKSVLKLEPELGLTQLYDYECRASEGYYSMAGDCDSYVECKKFEAFLNECPDGLHFNPKARWPEYPCAYPSEVQCESNSIKRLPHPSDECPQQYGFYPLDTDCSRYIMCQEGKAFVMNCPAGLAFSAVSSSCDWPENVPSCKPDVFHGFTCPAVPLEEDGSPSDMIFKYRYKESCKEYIACQRGHPRLLRCDPGLSFDEISEICVDSDYVSNCKYF